MSKLVVIDYGIGNVFSVCNALKKMGADPLLTRHIPTIIEADRVILPGVGAFAKAIAALKEYGLDDALKTFVATERPFLGICIGMQLLMDTSNEFGIHEGLGFMSGTVERIPTQSAEGETVRVPHISWAQVSPADHTPTDHWDQSVLADPDGLQEYYFVHSFQCKPTAQADILAHGYYGGNAITAAIAKDNITGVQFHPERSGQAGLDLLNRFLSK